MVLCNARLVIMIVGAVAAFISMLGAIVAYNYIASQVDDLQGIVQSWKEKPIVDIVIEPGASCPSGYNELPMPAWPGAHGSCDCRNATVPNGMTFEKIQETSTCGKVCNSTQANDWNCFSSPVVPQISLKRWNNGLLCVKRGSLTSVDRPVVKDNSCPDGYKLCSSSGFSSIFRGLQDTTSSVCQKTNEPCPITGLTINSNNITITRAGEASSVGLPIVGLELTRGRPCKFPSGSTSNPIAYTKPKPFPNGSPKAGCDDNRQDNVAGIKCSIPSSAKECVLQYLGCKKCDGSCSNLPAISCASEAPFSSDPFCSGQDSRVQLINSIEEPKLFGDNNVPRRYWYGENVLWSLYAKMETPWEDACSDTRSDVIGKESGVQTVKSYQLGLLLINIIAVILLSICIPCIEVRRGIHRMSKDEVKELELSDPSVKTLNRRKFFLKWLLNIVKFTIMLLCTFAALAIKDFYVGQAEFGCSDLLSDNTFYGLSNVLTNLAGIGNGLTAGGDAVKLGADSVGTWLGVV